MQTHLPRVLLVDDLEANLIALEATLQRLPCELVRAQSGNAALKELLKRDFAVMLLDVQMPEMDGYEVASYARSNSRTAHVPIVFLTATHQTEDGVLKGYGTGAVDYVFKPINQHILLSKVQVFLDLYNDRRRIADEVESHKKTMLELERANDALRQFNQAASHDLREPLRVAVGFLNALKDESAHTLGSESAHFLERSLSACGRMSSLLDSLLAYARLQKPSRIEEVDVSAVLDRVRSDLSPRITLAHGALVVEELATVRGDPDRLYQVFLNLVGNALKFAKPDEAPRVTVSCARERGSATFCVEDNGIGIEEKHHGEVFGAFRRLNSDDRYEGSGLGLAICRQIVEQHGGKIWVESRLGAGSKFFVNLPQPRSGLASPSGS
ncbi:MAG: response regulator [Deltaproteobacteria bacterium]|nr:response regulator [Deltaproteobacteria bacterium]